MVTFGILESALKQTKEELEKWIEIKKKVLRIVNADSRISNEITIEINEISINIGRVGF